MLNTKQEESTLLPRPLSNKDLLQLQPVRSLDTKVASITESVYLRRSPT